MKAGSGPRHLVFGSDGKHAYLTSELTATVSTFRYDDGKLTLLQSLPLTQPGFKGKVGAAAVHLSPDGRFLYATNRGDANEIVIFSVDPANGHLRLVGHQSSLGEAPREFAIDPTGQWLIVGNQNSDTAYVFRRDQQSGLLGPNPKRIDIGSPVDFKLVSPS
jgi:6-phosphogluconolactonase